MYSNLATVAVSRSVMSEQTRVTLPVPVSRSVMLEQTRHV